MTLPRVDKPWLDHVRGLRCCLTGVQYGVVPHHVRLAGTCGIGLKPPDALTVPMNRREHQRIHTEGTTTAEDALIYERLCFLLIEYIGQRFTGGEGF